MGRFNRVCGGIEPCLPQPFTVTSAAFLGRWSDPESGHTVPEGALSFRLVAFVRTHESVTIEVNQMVRIIRNPNLGLP